MKLREANKEDNRRFHELPEAERQASLEAWYQEVFAESAAARGEFSPAMVDPDAISVFGQREQNQEFSASADRLNFLMTRFHMEREPQYEQHIRELALLRFEYLLLRGNTDLTQNPELIVEFFSRRGKPELIRPVLARMGEQAVNYEHLAEKIIDHPLFQDTLGPEAVVYKFRARLHALVEQSHYSKIQAATALLQEGYDLVACDFNRWYKTESDFRIKIGDVPYEVSAKETAWLKKLVARQTTRTEEPAASEADLVALRNETEPEHQYQCSKEGLEVLAESVATTLAVGSSDPAQHWVKELVPLVSDHTALLLNTGSQVEARMWDNLWGGQFSELAYQLKGANPHGRTRNGLQYNLWALTHTEHSVTADPVLAQDSMALIIAGDILVGDLDAAKENFMNPALEQFKHPGKIRAAINLAWEMLQHPGESDDHDEYEPPRAYLFQIASDFGSFLDTTPTATPYRTLLHSLPGAELSSDETRILAAISCFDTVERVYTQRGMVDQISERFLEIFDRRFDSDTEFMALRSEVRGTVATIQHATFRRYVDDETIGARLQAAIERTLERKSTFDFDEPALGSSKLVLTLCQNSVLRPFLEGKNDIPALANAMIDDVVKRTDDLLTVPYSLRHQGEITMDSSEAIEAYMIADVLRDQIEPEKMQALVAYLLAINSEMTAGNSFNLTNLVINKVSAQADPQYQQPEYFPDAESSRSDQRLQFLSRVYEREKVLGGLDGSMAATAVTNVLYRGTYVQPERFYPRLDAVLDFLATPLAALLPTDGPGDDALREYKILKEFLERLND